MGSRNDPRRCRRCRKIPRGKTAEAYAERYAPFCSYHCQEWFRLEEAERYLWRTRQGRGLANDPMLDWPAVHEERALLARAADATEEKGDA